MRLYFELFGIASGNFKRLRRYIRQSHVRTRLFGNSKPHAPAAAAKVEHSVALVQDV